MLKPKYFLKDIFILSAEKQPIKLSWRKIVCLPIKTICSNAFGNSGIKELIIPASVNTIEPHAFDNCSMLEKVIIKDANKPLKWKGMQFNNCPKLHEIHLGRNSQFEYSLIANTQLKQLVLGKGIREINFDIQNIENLICLMKKPPHLPKNVKANNIYLKYNFDLYWVHPAWNKRNLQKYSD